MKCTLRNTKLSYLPLRDARLCTDCEFVSADEESVCPVCGSSSLLRLLELLEGGVGATSRFNVRSVLEHLGLLSCSATSRRRLRETTAS